MTSEKSKTNKKWASSQEYRDNFDRIFSKPPKNVDETCEVCGCEFVTQPVGWRQCPSCGHRWTKLGEAE